MTDYQVAIDVYSGPMDLLLYLIRRDEIDVYDIPISHITEQYLKFVQVLESLDPEQVSEFLVLAATLMEIKSRTLLPTPPPEESDEEFMDPRSELVRQLLEYKKFKDAARNLEDAAYQRAEKHPRWPVAAQEQPEEVELDDLDIWDLVSAFDRLLEQTGKAAGTHKVEIDDTPIALHADDILDSLERAGGSQPFDVIFGGRSRSEMIGLFLALLELIKQWRVRAAQDRSFGTIYLRLRNPEDAPKPNDEDFSDDGAIIDASDSAESTAGDPQASTDAVSSADVDTEASVETGNDTGEHISEGELAHDAPAEKTTDESAPTMTSEEESNDDDE